MGIRSARRTAAAVEARTLAQPPLLPGTPVSLLLEIRKCLLTAADEEVLNTPPHRILSLLKIAKEQRPDGATVALLSGGAPLDKGQETDEFFYRRDGARISFGMTVILANGGLTLRSYRFHLQFPPAAVPIYVRFDLNKGTGDGLLEPRCHVHAGAERLRVATPLMAPVEILEKLLYGMPGPPAP